MQLYFIDFFIFNRKSTFQKNMKINMLMIKMIIIKYIDNKVFYVLSNIDCTR